MELDGRRLLGFKIKAIAKLMAQDMTSRIASLELTRSQAFVLGYLCHHQEEDVYPRDVEKQFDFAHPTVSGLLQRLEAKGFILCEPSPEDRRCKKIVATAKAWRVNEQILQQMHTTEQALVAGMSQEEVRQLHALLDRMIQNIAPSSEEGGNHP